MLGRLWRAALAGHAALSRRSRSPPLLGAALALSAPTPWRRLSSPPAFRFRSPCVRAASTLPAWASAGAARGAGDPLPAGAWRDAPLFPTPKGALRGLAAQLSLPTEGRFLDAGCGLGDALVELHREFPRATLFGVEWSAPLRLACALRCRFATVRRVDMWTADWSGFDLVYVFQRPESMERVLAKASRELRPGAWLASLEFEADSRRPTWVSSAPMAGRSGCIG